MKNSISKLVVLEQNGDDLNFVESRTLKGQSFFSWD